MFIDDRAKLEPGSRVFEKTLERARVHLKRVHTYAVSRSVQYFTPILEGHNGKKR